jgi:hypothetical protein
MMQKSILTFSDEKQNKKQKQNSMDKHDGLPSFTML